MAFWCVVSAVRVCVCVCVFWTSCDSYCSISKKIFDTQTDILLLFELDAQSHLVRVSFIECFPSLSSSSCFFCFYRFNYGIQINIAFKYVINLSFKAMPSMEMKQDAFYVDCHWFKIVWNDLVNLKLRKEKNNEKWQRIRAKYEEKPAPFIV